MRAIRPLTKMFFDVHLMCSRPQILIEPFARAGADEIIVHVELHQQVTPLIWKIKSFGKKVGLAINPPTTITEVQPYLGQIDLLLVMTVNPGFGGQEFIHETLPKVQQAEAWRRERKLPYRIAVDGGINFETAAECARDGADVAADSLKKCFQCHRRPRVRADARAFGGGLKLMPPSTLMRYGSFLSRRHASACWIFGSVSWMNSCPPKPGLTVITSSRSIFAEVRLDERDGGGRVDGEADFFAERFDFPDERRDLLAQFDVNDDFVRAGPGKRFEQNFGLGTHEVDVKKHFGQRTNGADDFRAKGNVRHEMPVHDVEVQPVGAGTVGAFDFPAKTGVVGGEQRGRDNHALSLSK